MDREQAAAGGEVHVPADFENSGKQAGGDVAQLYIHQQAGSASRPVREGKGFQRVTLTRGETKPSTSLPAKTS